MKTATRNKHTPLNQYVSFSSTPGRLGGRQRADARRDAARARPVHDPVNQVISSEELRALVACISTALSELESRVLALYLDGHSYEEVGRRLGCDCKTVDNALQRVKRKVGQHLAERNVRRRGRCRDAAQRAASGWSDRSVNSAPAARRTGRGVAPSRPSPRSAP